MISLCSHRILGTAVLGLYLSLLGIAGDGQEQRILLDASQPGRVFEGIGACSAGASSRLLIEYPEPYRSRVLDYLFRPRFGAGFQHLKVEIGGDVNSTDGTEPSHQRAREDLNYERGYEWWLMKEAVRRNPGIFLDCLEWGAPGWIGDGKFYSQDNADYIVKFLQGASSAHGLRIHYTGIWNETAHDNEWIKLLRRTLDANGLESVKIVAPDEFSWDFVKEMQADPQLAASIHAVGIHYPGTKSSKEAQAYDRPLWSSEDGPWKGTWAGAAPLAKTYNRNYINGKMTKTIIWSPITSYYDALPLPRSGVMTANTPWSGAFEVQPALWATAHTTQFAEPGWSYLDGEACGMLTGGGSYVTLVSTNHLDYSVIVETVDAKGSQTLEFQLAGGMTRRSLKIWRSSAEKQFVCVGTARVHDGRVRVRVDPGCIYSLSSTRGQSKGGWGSGPRKAFPTPYLEDFERGKPGTVPRYLSDQAGAFEIAARPDGKGQALCQVLPQRGIEWPFHKDPLPETVVGDLNWRNYTMGVEAFLPAEGSISVFGRITRVPQSTDPPEGYWLQFGTAGSWQLRASTNLLAEGACDFATHRWHQIKIGFSGDIITAFLDGSPLTTVTNQTFRRGMVGVGSGWNQAWFDNLSVVPTAGAKQPFEVARRRSSQNLLLRKPAKSSSTEFSYSAENLVDCEPDTTRWAGSKGRRSGDWVEFDLGGDFAIHEAILRPYDTAILGYRIQYWDNTGWKDVFVGGAMAFPVQHDVFPAVTARRVRLLVTDTQWTPSLWEMELYGARRR